MNGSPGARLLAVAALSMLSACSIAPRHPGAAAPLLSPSSLGATRAASQVVRGAFGENEFAFQCVIDAQPESVTVVGLNALGQRGFTLHLDRDGSMTGTDANLAVPLEPRRVLTDLQLALWPLAAWEQALGGTEWQVNEPVAGTRRLRHNGHLVAEVHYAGADPWRSRLWLINFEDGYTLTVDSQALP